MLRPGPLQGPGTLGSAPLTPTKCIAKAGTRQDRPTAKKRCQETLFFLPFRKTLPGPGTAQSLPRTHNRPEPFPRASRQPPAASRSQCCTRVSKCAPAGPGTAPLRAAGPQLHGLDHVAWAPGPQFTCVARCRWCPCQGIPGDVRGEADPARYNTACGPPVTVLSFRPRSRHRPGLLVHAGAPRAPSPGPGCAVRAWTRRSELWMSDACWPGGLREADL